MVSKKPKDPPLRFNKKGFDVFRPKRPRELMPIIGTGQGRGNERNYNDNSYRSADGAHHVYVHDVEAENEREYARQERENKIFANFFEYWIVYPYEIIKTLILKIFGRHNNNPLGLRHVISFVFLVAVSYHAVNLYWNPENLLAFAWICSIILLSLVIAALTSAMR